MPQLVGGRHAFGGGASQGVMACLTGRLLCDTYLSGLETLEMFYEECWERLWCHLYSGLSLHKESWLVRSADRVRRLRISTLE